MEDDKSPVTGQGSQTTPAPERTGWPNQLTSISWHQHSSKSNPMGEGSTIVKSFKKSPRPGGRKKGHPRTDDKVAGLVAEADFGHLRAFVHPYGMAQRWHLPDGDGRGRAQGTATSALRPSTAGPTM